MAVYLVRQKADRRILVFMLATAVLYAIIMILPTRYTDRSLLPFTILAACILAPCVTALGKLVGSYTNRTVASLGVLLAILFIGHPLQSFEYIRGKYADMRYNEKILGVLYDAGLQDSSQVYSNYFEIYPLDDPEFVTFHNHGGWLLLDSKYARERPNPERPKTLPAWESFFRGHGLRYIVLNKQDASYSEFFTDGLPAQWDTIFEDSHFLVLILS